MPVLLWWPAYTSAYPGSLPADSPTGLVTDCFFFPMARAARQTAGGWSGDFRLLLRTCGICAALAAPDILIKRKKEASQ